MKLPIQKRVMSTYQNHKEFNVTQYSDLVNAILKVGSHDCVMHDEECWDRLHFLLHGYKVNVVAKVLSPTKNK